MLDRHLADMRSFRELLLAQIELSALGVDAVFKAFVDCLHAMKVKTRVIGIQITCVGHSYNLSYHFWHDPLRHLFMPGKERPIDQVVRLAGGQAELARRCNTSQPRIWQCINRNQRVPADLVIPLEKAVMGEVTRHQLRPDLYPVEITEAPSE